MKNKLEPLHITTLLGLVFLTKLTVDLYVPILISIKDQIHADNLSMKLSLTTYMIGFAFSLLASNPLAERFGSKKIMIISTINYIVASLLCAFAGDINTIIFARILQSLSGGSGTVLGRLEVKHHYQKFLQIKALSYISAATAISPVILPALANYINLEYGWRIVFLFMALFSVGVLALVGFCIEESPKKTKTIAITNLLRIYKELLSNKFFLVITFVTICTWCTYFIYFLTSELFFRQGCVLAGYRRSRTLQNSYQEMNLFGILAFVHL